MECLSCKHNASDELFGDPAKCPECGVYQAKIRARLERQDASKKSTTAIKINVFKAYRRLFLFVFILLVVVFFSFVLRIGYLWFKRDATVSEFESIFRVANSYVTDTFENKQKLSGAEYLDKAYDRSKRLDELSIKASAMDDKYAKGLSGAASAYILGLREVVLKKADYIKAGIALENAKSILSLYKGMADSLDQMARNPRAIELLDSEIDSSLKGAEPGNELSKRVDMIRRAGAGVELRSQYVGYIKSKSDVANASAALERSRSDFSSSVEYADLLGKTASNVAGREIPLISISSIR